MPKAKPYNTKSDKRLEREVGELERKLNPAERRMYVNHLLLCQKYRVVVSAQTRLEWLRELRGV